MGSRKALGSVTYVLKKLGLRVRVQPTREGSVRVRVNLNPNPDHLGAFPSPHKNESR